MLKDIASTGSKDTRSGFGDGIVAAARKNPNIVALTADLAGSLKLNQFARIQLETTELKIKFSKLISDSRCPPDAYCTGMGRTIIAIELNDSTYVIGPDSSSITYGSYNIKLQQVSYNTKRNFGKERHCRITLRVD